MKRLLGLTLFASCAAVVVTGCGTQAAPAQTAPSSKPVASSKSPSAPSTAPKPPSPSQTPTAVSPRQRAVADAAAILASFVPPPGAWHLAAAPGADGGALRQPMQVPGSPDLVDDASWWLAPGQPQAVLAWEQAHLPRRFASAGSSTSYLHGVPTEWSDEFSLPDVPAVLNLRELVVQVVSAGRGQTALRVDAQVTWLPAKPPDERVPAGAVSVTISEVPGPAGGKRPAPVTITDKAKLRKIAALADGLPLFPPGIFSCPADNGKQLVLTFRGHGDRTLAVVAADPTGCGTVSFTVGGKSLPTLWGGASFVRQVLAIAGLHWQLFGFSQAG